jgi:hypothetical protein
VVALIRKSVNHIASVRHKIRKEIRRLAPPPQYYRGVLLAESSDPFATYPTGQIRRYQHAPQWGAGMFETRIIIDGRQCVGRHEDELPASNVTVSLTVPHGNLAFVSVTANCVSIVLGLTLSASPEDIVALLRALSEGLVARQALARRTDDTHARRPALLCFDRLVMQR